MTTPRPTPAGPSAPLPRMLLAARLVLAAAVVALCAALVIAAATLSPEPILSTDRVLRVIATALLVAVGALLLLVEVVAAFKVVAALRAADPTAALVRVSTRPSKTAGAAALCVCAVIGVAAILSSGAAPAATVGLLGVGLVSLILDTVAAVGAYRHVARSPSAATPSPATTRRLQSELTLSVALGQVLSTLLALSAVGIVVEQWIDGVPRPAAAVLQVGAGALAALVAFALAAVLRGMSRCITGDGVARAALPRSVDRLQLAVGAAVVATVVACLAVLSTDYAVDQLPTYQALASVFVILLGVLNSVSLGQLHVSGLAPAIHHRRD